MSFSILCTPRHLVDFLLTGIASRGRDKEMIRIKGKVKYSGLLASLTLVLVAALPGFATAQQAVFYEIVENLDGVRLQTTGHRVSNWTAQGTAEAGSPFCPEAVLPPGSSSCTITAFGTDDIDLTAVESGEYFVGKVWANVVAVANLDNVVDGPELAAFSGQITGKITIQASEPGVEAELRQQRKLVGPAIPLIYVRNGKFFPDAVPVIRTSPPVVRPLLGHTARFDSTFRLPFTVDEHGRRAKPQRGKQTYYLADDGSFIRVKTQDEFALGFALLRAEVYFK